MLTIYVYGPPQSGKTLVAEAIENAHKKRRVLHVRAAAAERGEAVTAADGARLLSITDESPEGSDGYREDLIADCWEGDSGGLIVFECDTTAPLGWCMWYDHMILVTAPPEGDTLLQDEDTLRRSVAAELLPLSRAVAASSVVPSAPSADGGPTVEYVFHEPLLEVTDEDLASFDIGPVLSSHISSRYLIRHAFKPPYDLLEDVELLVINVRDEHRPPRSPKPRAPALQPQMGLDAEAPCGQPVGAPANPLDDLNRKLSAEVVPYATRVAARKGSGVYVCNLADGQDSVRANLLTRIGRMS